MREDDADAAWSIVRATFDAVERDLTRFDPDSALSRLNRAAGGPVGITPILARALRAAWRAFRASGGRFDPRILGALEVAGERAGVLLPASPARLDPADQWLKLDTRRGRACVSAPVDLGGIGKGLALRWATASLRADGHGRFLLGAGGDVVGAGVGPADRPWVIGLEDPTGARQVLDYIEVRDAAVATSSVAVRAWTGADGSIRHHLIDPSTLEPAPVVWSSVTVLDRDPAWAEVRSKVGFLAGRDIAAISAGRRAWWVSPAGVLHSSASPA